MRKRLDLNFNWQYTPDFKETYINNEPENLDTVQIPHANIELPYHYFNEKDYQFVSCYINNITLDDTYQDRQLNLHFEGVMGYAEVYMNGTLVGTHKGGYTGFYFDVTEYLKLGEENRMVVKVDSTERDDIPPFGHVIDYLTYGGIYREVYLEALSKNHIEALYIKTSDVLQEEKSLEVEVHLNQVIEEGKFEFHLWDKENLIQTFTYVLDKNPVQNIIQKIREVQLWNLKDPNLYKLQVKLYDKNELIDEKIETFGFREVAFKPDGFYLNQEKIKLRGLNRHQAYPYVGYAMPKSAQEEDADILKYDLGVNIVRTSHYPQSKHFLNHCDEIGLLVFSEIPGWQHIGNSDWKEVAKQNVREMITRDYNHPSIIIWGVRINESQDDDAFYQETNEIAHLLDDTRPTGGVRNFAHSHLFEDVYTYNDFVHSGINEGLRNRSRVVKQEVPYLVTEHNGHMFPTKKFDQENKRVEQALRHLRVLNSMYQSEEISGAIGWCMVDYNTHQDFGSGDKICYHGVMDMFRTKKIASYAYSSQQDDRPVMYVSSDMNIGEYDASMLPPVYVFTNCDYVEFYKNDQYINTFYPLHEEFKYLPHPPVLIDDFIGDALIKNESFSKRDSKRIKDAFKEMQKKQKVSLSGLMKMGLVMFKNKMKYQDAYDLYTKYIAGWGEKSLFYHFKGYKDGQLVLESTKGPSSRSTIDVKVYKTQLIEDATYDVTRVALNALDEHGNLLPYANDSVEIIIDGPADVIGPKQFSLIGGSRAFYIKTIGRSGKVTVAVKTHYTSKKIELDVIKR